LTQGGALFTVKRAVARNQVGDVCPRGLIWRSADLGIDDVPESRAAGV